MSKMIWGGLTVAAVLVAVGCPGDPYENIACDPFPAKWCSGDTVFESHWVGSSACEGEYVTEAVHTCRKGCIPAEYTRFGHPYYDRFIAPWGFLPPSAAFCAESLPREPGDPCENDSDCHPTALVVTPTGPTGTQHLRCDLALQECVPGDPPTVEGWLEPCGLSIDASLPPGYTTWREASGCPGELCLIHSTQDCIYQGCTIPCTYDGDCPAGALCVNEWNHPTTYGGWEAGACQPWWTLVSDFHGPLVCPPAP